MEKETLMQAAKEIQRSLNAEFPDAIRFQHQCKRASILMDLYLKKKKVRAHIESGWIVKKGEKASERRNPERGHVWNVVYLKETKYLLDVTLGQFSLYLGEDVPDVVFLPCDEGMEQYGYLSDYQGKYPYRSGDVRETLIKKMNEIK